MADSQFDVSEKMKKLFTLKQKLRNEAKAYYAKAMENPHRPMNDPPPFDPVFFRYSSLQSYAYEHFRPNPKNSLFLILFTITPIIGTAIYLHNYHNEREKLIRSGKIPYDQRRFRNIY